MHDAHHFHLYVTRFVHYELDPEPEGDVLQQQQQPGQQGQDGVMVPRYLQVGQGLIANRQVAAWRHGLTTAVGRFCL